MKSFKGLYIKHFKIASLDLCVYDVHLRKQIQVNLSGFMISEPDSLRYPFCNVVCTSFDIVVRIIDCFNSIKCGWEHGPIDYDRAKRSYRNPPLDCCH